MSTAGENAVSPSTSDKPSRENSKNVKSSRGREVITTDSIPQSSYFKAMPFARLRSLSEFTGEIIYKIHYDLSVMEGPI